MEVAGVCLEKPEIILRFGFFLSGNFDQLINGLQVEGWRGGERFLQSHRLARLPLNMDR